jgi:hypothetical protein
MRREDAGICSARKIPGFEIAVAFLPVAEEVHQQSCMDSEAFQPRVEI